jgi:FAD synthetase
MNAIPAIYIPVPSPFTDLELFIEDAAKLYGLDLFLCRGPSDQVESVVTPGTAAGPELIDAVVLKQKPAGKAKGGDGMKQALLAYKMRFPNIDAILIGTRRTDPHGGKHLLVYTSLYLGSRL